MMWRHVVHALVEDYERLGWRVEPPVRFTHHDLHSVPMRWLCQCPPVEPVKFPRTVTSTERD